MADVGKGIARRGRALGSARADGRRFGPCRQRWGLSSRGFLARDTPVICPDQTYALCAGASCLVFNDVAYCTCDVLSGDSLSWPLSYPCGNVCTVNAQGAGNGFVVSTFSLPTSIVVPSGTQALYTCPPSRGPPRVLTPRATAASASRARRGGRSGPRPARQQPDRVLLPDHDGRLGCGAAGPPDLRPLPMPGLLPELHQRGRQHEQRLDPLRRRPPGSVRLNTLLLIGTAPCFNTCLAP